MFILENYLNESTDTENDSIVKPEPLSEASWITPDANGLALIKAEDQRYENKLSKALIFAESVVYTKNLKGLDTVELQESVVGDFLGKVVTSLKDAWKRMVTWFSNLFKSISVAMVDVKKSLKDIEKVLNPKDFKEFKHDAHKWKSSNISDTMQSVITSTSTELTNAMKKDIEEFKADLGKSANADDNDTSRKEDDNKYKDVDNSENIKVFIGKLVGGQAMTMEEAKDVITKSYGYDESGEEKGLDWKPMVDFMRKFEDNKILREAQKKCDEIYSKAIKAAEDAVSAANSAKGRVKSTDSNVKNASSWYDKGIRKIQSVIIKNKTCLNNYDSLMGTCIDMEKAKFSEYRGTISSAIRYNHKKDN